MAREYTKEDLEKDERIFANRLRTRVLEEFYTDNLTSKVYIYILDNGEIIRLLFENEQFCHLLGFSYFGYSGISGWLLLDKRNMLISNLQGIANHKREEIRITNFPKITKILNNPKVYLYKNVDMRYKTDYFAVWDDGKRYYKLGIGTSSNGINYGETYQVSLIHSKDNKEINPNYLLQVNNKMIIPKESFKKAECLVHIAEEGQENQNKELTSKQNNL